MSVARSMMPSACRPSWSAWESSNGKSRNSSTLRGRTAAEGAAMRRRRRRSCLLYTSDAADDM
eukprot:13383760-Alexandrium_andersonii.AAC.1